MSDEAAEALREAVPICAIGASAGGVVALQELFKSLPDDLGLAYVVVLHLPPEQPSLLSEILAPCTPMAVSQVVESAELRANHVHVISPNRELTVEGDRIEARPASGAARLRTPIDTLLRSIATRRGDGIAVVMTGAGQDGARGVRAIKEGGGIVIVQDPADAEYPTMPLSAIETGAADYVEPLGQIVGRIELLARSKQAIRVHDDADVETSVRRILALTRTRTGHDFSAYKSGTVIRRIRRRAQLSRRTSIEDYATYVSDNPAEAKHLFTDLLISVTSFFRDQDAFGILERGTLPGLFDRDEEELRVWVVGCASGEEAYSVAILLLEEAERRLSRKHLQVFATDLDEEALATARLGIYPRLISADVSDQRLKRFFVDEGSHYRVCAQLRDMVLFATHSVVRDPPFTRLDLVSCRNLLIYFERHLQQQVSATFHYALRTGGYLFLGPAEMPDLSSSLFELEDREARIYRSGPRDMSSLPLMSDTTRHIEPVRNEHRRIPPRREDTSVFLGAAHLSALEENAPPSALVDRERRIVNLSPTAGRFLLLPGGPLSEELPAIVRPELRGELLIALERVFDSRSPIVTRAVDVSFETERKLVFLHVARLPVVQGESERALVCFLEGESRVTAGGETSAGDNPWEDEIRRLRSDLGAAQQAALTSRAEHGFALQDLRVANEELQSLNEEYRSTAEELETSKEELQSVNEELRTVNVELRSKVLAISGAHNDLLNLTATSEIGTLFLDPDLKIRMFTPPIATLFNVSEVDVGRGITDFAHRLVYSSLERDVRSVLRDEIPIETEIRGPEGRWLLLRIRPYRTTDDKVSGAVVTFNDITTRKREIALGESEARYRAFALASSDVMYRMSADWRVLLRLDGRDMLEDTTEPTDRWLERYPMPEDVDRILATVENAVRDKAPFELDHRVRRRDGSIGWARSRAVPILDAGGEITEWLGIATDVTMGRVSFTALQADEAQLRNLTDLVPCLLWQSDPDGNVIFVNRRWSDYTGQSLQQARNAGWLDVIHPDDLEAARSTLEKAVESGQPLERRLRMLRADGASRWFLVRHVPHCEDGVVARWYGAATDIDQLVGEMSAG